MVVTGDGDDELERVLDLQTVDAEDLRGDGQVEGGGRPDGEEEEARVESGGNSQARGEEMPGRERQEG